MIYQIWKGKSHMEQINAVTFGFMSKRGEWETEACRSSLKQMQERCGATHVILPIVATQNNPQSTTIDWQADTVLSDTEVIQLIKNAKDLGLSVILKPMVNVADGTWRAHINFFDHDVPCEPKWSEWFSSYESYILHYAKIAEATKCEMFVIGCELVNSDRREAQWRQLIAATRKVYHGLMTYNCDKYQENHVNWWDALDVISSSGYYPIDQWDNELSRIETVVKQYNKPFFFCEVGCPSREGSQFIPNDWQLKGQVDQVVQAQWYEEMFDSCQKYQWVQGFGIWDWKASLYPIEQAAVDTDYAVYGKSVERVIKKYFNKII